MRLVEDEVLGCPHLMLAHIGRHDRVLVLRELVDPVDDVLRLDHRVRRLHVGQRVLGLPVVDLVPPGLALLDGMAVRCRLEHGIQFLEHGLDVSHDRDVHLDVLADGRRVDVDVDDLGLRTELRDLSGDPVVEPGPDGDDEVREVDRHVGGVRAVHPHHAERQCMRAGEGAQGHERHVHGDLRQLGKLQQLRLRVGEDRAAAHVDDRLPGLVDGLHGLLDLPLVPFVGRVIAADGHAVRVAELALVHRDVLRDVHQHGARPAGRGDVEGLLDDLPQVVHVLDQEVVLGAWPADADVVRLLEGVVADEMGGDLAGEDDDRDRVHVGVHQRSDHVGHARPGGDQRDARLARGLRIALRHVAGTSFVPGQNDLDILLLVQDIEDLQHHAAREAEDGLDPFALEALHKDFGTRELHRNSLSPA